jgi:hypothetical protein
MLTAAVCAALSAAGLAVALLTAYRRRFLSATRIAAAALLPVGLAMSGLLKLGGTIGSAVGEWAAGLVFKPTVWVGFGVLAVAGALFFAARVAGRRGGDRRERTAALPAERGTAVAPGASAPSLGPGRSTARPGTRPGKTSDGLEDFRDIEAILKKHGI